MERARLNMHRLDLHENEEKDTIEIFPRDDDLQVGREQGMGGGSARAGGVRVISVSAVTVLGSA